MWIVHLDGPNCACFIVLGIFWLKYLQISWSRVRFSIDFPCKTVTRDNERFLMFLHFVIVHSDRPYQNKYPLKRQIIFWLYMYFCKRVLRKALLRADKYVGDIILLINIENIVKNVFKKRYTFWPALPVLYMSKYSVQIVRNFDEFLRVRILEQVS